MTNGWIPTKKHLPPVGCPDNRGYCYSDNLLFCDETGTVHPGWFSISLNSGFYAVDESDEDGDAVRHLVYEVDAWMPFPEPYREEANE